MRELTLTADFAQFQRKLAWAALLLESRDVRERLGDGLIDRLLKALAGGGGDEFGKLGRITTDNAGNLTVDVEITGVLDEVFTALRALGFDFHEAPTREIDTTSLESTDTQFQFLKAPDAGLIALVRSWERRAKQKLECGLRTNDPMARRLVEHGGMCYFNCAAELRQALGVASLPTLPIPVKQ